MLNKIFPEIDDKKTTVYVQGISKLMRNIEQGNFQKKLGDFTYKVLFKTTLPPSYSPLKLNFKKYFYLICTLWKNLEE